jgi:hypothetical protein
MEGGGAAPIEAGGAAPMEAGSAAPMKAGSTAPLAGATPPVVSRERMTARCGHVLSTQQDLVDAG